MAVTSENQKRYNQRYREKQSKIKKFSKQLDVAVEEMETLAKCQTCAAMPGQACTHTPARKALAATTEHVRSALQQLAQLRSLPRQFYERQYLASRMLYFHEAFVRSLHRSNHRKALLRSAFRFRCGLLLQLHAKSHRHQ